MPREVCIQHIKTKSPFTLAVRVILFFLIIDFKKFLFFSATAVLERALGFILVRLNVS